MDPQPPTGARLPLADELTAVFARMSGLLLSRETVGSVLDLLTSLAVETVPGAAGAGLTLIDAAGRRTTSSATDPLVERADARQYALDEGPCLAAAALRQVVRVDDVAADRRWPRWAREAAALGLGSAVSAPMVADGASLGAVKVYASAPAAFDAHSEEVMSLFSAQAAILVANVQAYERAERLSEALRQAVRSRDVVNVAKGVLIARHGVDEDGAFRLLLEQARREAGALAETARLVVESAITGRQR